MRCPNCDHNNPKDARICGYCGADFDKTSKANQRRVRRGAFGSLAATLTGCFSYTVILLLILTTIAAVAVFNCLFDVPEAPQEGYSPTILTIWEAIDTRQIEKCSDIGFEGSK
jgi:hypothetical protein